MATARTAGANGPKTASILWIMGSWDYEILDMEKPIQKIIGPRRILFDRFYQHLDQLGSSSKLDRRNSHIEKHQAETTKVE